MWSIALRILIGAALIVGSVALADWLLGTNLLGVTLELILWFLRLASDFIVRLVLAFALMMRAVLQRVLSRRILRPLWRFLTLYSILYFLGEVRNRLIERWFQVQKSRILEQAKRIVAARPDWPRSAYGWIAFLTIAFLIWAFYWISENIGLWWGAAASIVFWETMKYVRVLGFDMLASWVTEKCAPVKAFLDRHPWVRTVLLLDLLKWLSGKVEGIKVEHRKRNRGRGKLDEWRERRRAKKDREKAAGAY